MFYKLGTWSEDDEGFDHVTSFLGTYLIKPFEIV